MEPPAAICFDMGYTLLRHSYDARPALTELLVAEGHAVDPEALAGALLEARAHYLAAVRSGRDFETSMPAAVEFWTEYTSRILDRVGVPAAAHAELSRRSFTRAWSPDAWEPFPEVPATLRELRRRGTRMAVISNFVDTLHALCARHDLTQFFETVVCSTEVGLMKPDPRIFALAARRLEVAAEAVWYVGDSYWADVLGARAAGMTPVWLDRDGAVERPDCVAIRRLDELLPLLDREAAA